MVSSCRILLTATASVSEFPDKFLACAILSVTGWRPVKPPAMPEATYSIFQLNRKSELRLGHVTSRRVERDNPVRPALHALAGHEGHPLFLPPM